MKKTISAPIKIMITLSGAALFLSSAALLPALQEGSDVLAQLALDAGAAKSGVLDALASGHVYNYAAMEAFKALPATARAAIVRGGLGWVKAYVATPEFKASYDAHRNGKKPGAPAVRPSSDEHIKQQKADFEKQVADMRKGMAGLDAATRASMEQSIKEMRAQLEALEKDPGQKELMRQMTEMARSEDNKKYQEQLEVWNENFPAEPRLLIKKRVKDFLVMSANIDYAAKLVPRRELLVFANEDYERKPPEWKLCFRAGKEATEAARAFAKAWLAELEKK